MKNLIRLSIVGAGLLISNGALASGTDSTQSLPSQYHQLDKDISINAFHLWHEIASPTVCTPHNLRDFRTFTWMSDRINLSGGHENTIVPVGKEFVSAEKNGANRYKIYFIDLGAASPKLLSREMVVSELWAKNDEVSITWVGQNDSTTQVEAIGSRRIVANTETGKDMCGAIQMIRNNPAFETVLKTPFEKRNRSVSSTHH